MLLFLLQAGKFYSFIKGYLQRHLLDGICCLLHSGLGLVICFGQWDGRGERQPEVLACVSATTVAHAHERVRVLRDMK